VGEVREVIARVQVFVANVKHLVASVLKMVLDPFLQLITAVVRANGYSHGA
jgi:alanine racemase